MAKLQAFKQVLEFWMLDIRYILLHTATTSAFTTTIIMRLPPLADQQKAAVLPNSAEVRKDL